MQISDRTRYVSVETGPGAAGHRWTKARSKFVGICARICSSSQSLVLSFQDLLPCLSSPSLVLLPNPIQLTLRLRILRFQDLRLALFTHCRELCCGGEVPAALKWMWTVSSLRARLRGFALRPVPTYSQQALRAQEPQMSMMAEPLG